MVKINIDRMQEHLDSDTINVPTGLSREEKRELILSKKIITYTEFKNSWLKDANLWIDDPYEYEGVWVSGITSSYRKNQIECYSDCEKEAEYISRLIMTGLESIRGETEIIPLDKTKEHKINSLQSEVNYLQYKIDELMLEYCPNEMTKEQLINYANNQRVSKIEI